MKAKEHSRPFATRTVSLITQSPHYLSYPPLSRMMMGMMNGHPIPTRAKLGLMKIWKNLRVTQTEARTFSSTFKLWQQVRNTQHPNP